MVNKKKIAKNKQFTKIVTIYTISKWLEITDTAGEIKVGLRKTCKKYRLNLQWPDQLHNLDVSYNPSKDDCTVFLGDRYKI